jgi:hypothetical protein
LVGILKAVHPKRWKVPGIKDQWQRWLSRGAVALAVLLGVILIGWIILRVKHMSTNSLISPSQTASPAKQPAGQPTPLRGGSPQEGFLQQETRVAGVVAELTRFVRTGNLITAEVTFRNTGSVPAKYSCNDWRLIDEQTGAGSTPTAQGGGVNPYVPATLAPGETHVAWAKFNAEAGELSGNKYSVNIKSILNRPFEGLALTGAVLPQPSKQETRVAGVVAELTRFVRTGNLITAEVTFRNAGSVPAKYSCND